MSGWEIAAAVIVGLIGFAGLAVAAYSAFALVLRKLWSYNERPAEDLHDDMLIAAAMFAQHPAPGQPYLGYEHAPILRQRDYELIAEAVRLSKEQEEGVGQAEGRTERT